MVNIWINAFIGLLVGILGTGLGGLVSLSLVRPNSRFLGMILGGTGGIMLAVITFDLLPESYEIGGIWIELLGIALGIITIMIIENIFPLENKNNNMPGGNYFKTGVLVAMGIAMHNLPEGLAIGSGFMLTSEMGIKVAIIIALHNIPEGVAMATPLRMGGSSRLKVLLLAILAGTPTGIGALIGGLLGSVSEFFIALCLSFAGGTMLYITCGELIPNSKDIHKGRASTVGLILGFMLGILVVGRI